MSNLQSAQILQGESSLISLPLEIGVFPYPMAIADPSFQKAISPIFTVDLALFSNSTFNPVSKKNSSPHFWIFDFSGNEL